MCNHKSPRSLPAGKISYVNQTTIVMKKIAGIILAAALFSIQGLFAQPTAQTVKEIKNEKVNGPVAKFDLMVFDMGEIAQNVPRTATFKLSNEGNEPLLISTAQASCGCTGLSYEKEPILPGKSADISAIYNAAALGNFSKSITVRTNASDQPVVLQIKGVVVEKK